MSVYFLGKFCVSVFSCISISFVVLSVLLESSLCLFLMRVVSPCFLVKFVYVFWCVWKFCCKHGVETEMRRIFLLSLLLTAAGHHRYHGCIYGGGSEFISELSGHWIWVSGSSYVFWVWVIVKLFYAVLFWWKAGSRVGSFLYVPSQSELPDTVTEGKKAKQTSQKKIILGLCKYSVP